LLKDGVDPNVTLGVYDKTLFSRAEGRFSPINSGAWTALIALAYSQEKADRQIGIARDLLRAGARIDIADGFGVTSLDAAIMNDAVELALFLIKQGAPVNGTIKNMLDDVGDETPLHLAVGHPLIVEALIAAGCNLQARDGAGKSAWDTAKALGYSESEAIIAKAMRIKKR
jgi:ankyrin repeat protein